MDKRLPEPEHEPAGPVNVQVPAEQRRRTSRPNLPSEQRALVVAALPPHRVPLRDHLLRVQVARHRQGHAMQAREAHLGAKRVPGIDEPFVRVDTRGVHSGVLLRREHL